MRGSLSRNVRSGLVSLAAIAMGAMAGTSLANQQRVLPADEFFVSGGPAAGMHSSPEVAFAAAQAGYKQIGSSITLSDLRVCTAADKNLPQFSYKVNGRDQMYCMTGNYNEGPRR
jgi:hypothetical protein